MRWILLSLWLSSAVVLPFGQLTNQEEANRYRDTEVMVTGFLYRSSDNRWVLATEPNLKSCCVAMGDLSARQILLPHDFPGFITQQPVTLEGVARGSSTHLLELQQVSLVKRSSSSTLIWIGMALLISACASLIGRKRALK